MKTFSKGGVHPPEEKITSGFPLKKVESPEKLYVPVIQHIGAPAIPVVKSGDEVKMGQLIAESGGKVSASIHSPVSGKILKIEERMLFTGVDCQHIVIENDGNEEWAEGINLEQNTDSLTTEEIIQAVSNAGIVGMGGAAFPTDVKLMPPNPVDTLVINGAECEPYLTCDHRLMLEKAHEVVAGISLIQRAIGATRTIIGIEENKTDSAMVMQKAIKEKRLAGMRVEICNVKYPQGAEKQLIDSLTGRKVPPRSLPFSVGVIVQNVGTAFAVYQACKFKIPLIERALTVSGDGIENPGNFIVKIGTLFNEFVTPLGVKDNTKRLISGGPMMGFAIPSLDYPVMKGTSGILALTKLPRNMNHPCIRCGRCVDSCPMGLMPSLIGNSVEGSEIEEYENLGVPDCVECGSCAFICPAGRPLVQYAKKGKNELIRSKK